MRATTADAAVAALFGVLALMLLGQAFAGFAARRVVRDLELASAGLLVAAR